MFNFSVVTPGVDNYSFKASILTFDGDTKILADPSWDGQDPDAVLFMEHHLKEVQLILLSHSTPEFISGYVLLCIKFPNLMSSISVYSTLPVNQLGRISTVEYYRANGILGPLKSALLELDDVDEWFDRINLLKYLQSTTVLESKLGLTPYNAGHTLGGTFWLITKRIEKVIYAPAWNHSKDSFLNSAAFMSSSTGNPLTSLMRPTALITNSDLGSLMPHKKRIEKFLTLVDATLANGGPVLLPTSLSGRFLELFRLIDEHLSGHSIPVYFLSYLGTKILSYASNLLDWMTSGLMNEWDDDMGDTSGLPFAPSKVDLLMDPSELIQLSGPKIIFCSGSDLANGDLSTEVFKNICQDEKTTILITEKSSFGTSNTLSSMLYKEWFTLAKQKNGKPEDGVAVPLEKVISIDTWTREELLAGVELLDFQEKINGQRREKLLVKVRDKKNQNMLNADTVDAEDSTDDEEVSSDEEELVATTEIGNDKQIQTEQEVHVVDELTAHEAFVTDYIKQALEHNQPLDLKITHKMKPRQAMFPYFVAAHKQKFDDYGEIIDSKDFQKTDEVSNTQIIMEGKKKFEENERRNGPRTERRDGGTENRLTPQEMLNNQLLQKNLDTMFNPRKRIPLNSGSSFSSKSSLRMRCGLSYIDLSGLVDLRSLNMIVSSLKPYNLILLPDTTAYDQNDEELNGLFAVSAMFLQQQDESKKDETKKQLFTSSRYLSLSNIRSELSSEPLKNNTKMNILQVHINETLKIGGAANDDEVQALNNFEVKLDDNLVKDLHWQNIDGSYRVARVFGELELYNNTDKKRKEVGDYINPTTLYTLKKAKTESTGGNPKLAIGNIRLPELKKKLQSRNLNSEFKSEGTLVVNDTLAIRKVAYSFASDGDDTGDVVIEGNVGVLYYQVKECIKEMLAYV